VSDVARYSEDSVDGGLIVSIVRRLPSGGLSERPQARETASGVLVDR